MVESSSSDRWTATSSAGNGTPNANTVEGHKRETSLSYTIFDTGIPVELAMPAKIAGVDVESYKNADGILSIVTLALTHTIISSATVGYKDGIDEGTLMGLVDGQVVGDKDGSLDGTTEGTDDGGTVYEGLLDGQFEGTDVGAEGTLEGA